MQQQKFAYSLHHEIPSTMFLHSKQVPMISKLLGPSLTPRQLSRLSTHRRIKLSKVNLRDIKRRNAQPVQKTVGKSGSGIILASGGGFLGDMLSKIAGPVVGALTSLIPGVGPFLAPVAGIAANKLVGAIRGKGIVLPSIGKGVILPRTGSGMVLPGARVGEGIVLASSKDGGKTGGQFVFEKKYTKLPSNLSATYNDKKSIKTLSSINRLKNKLRDNGASPFAVSVDQEELPSEWEQADEVADNLNSDLVQIDSPDMQNILSKLLSAANKRKKRGNGLVRKRKRVIFKRKASKAKRRYPSFLR